MIINIFNFRLFLLLFLFVSLNGCSFYGISQADWIWMQMNEQQKHNALDSYYAQHHSSSQEPYCSESITTLREELMQLKTDNARLQAKLHQNEDTVVFMPPAF